MKRTEEGKQGNFEDAFERRFGEHSPATDCDHQLAGQLNPHTTTEKPMIVDQVKRMNIDNANLEKQVEATHVRCVRFYPVNLTEEEWVNLVYAVAEYKAATWGRTNIQAAHQAAWRVRHGVKIYRILRRVQRWNNTVVPESVRPHACDVTVLVKWIRAGLAKARRRLRQLNGAEGLVYHARNGRPLHVVETT